MNEHYVDQPSPRGGKTCVRPEVERLFAEILEYQCAKGEAKHGTPLKTHNGRDCIQDLLGELVDAFQYAVQGLLERNELRQRVTELEAENALLRKGGNGAT